ETIKLNSGVDERSEWVRLFDKIPHLRVKPHAKTRQIEVRAEAKLTVDEIKKIIESFAQESRKKTDWDNVGFATDSSIVWVDSYRLHEVINFSVEKSTIPPAADMYARLAS